MEEQLNWERKLSLKQLALRRVAANVWNEPDILALIEKCQFNSRSNDSVHMWRETVENEVKVKISNLELPKSLKKQMLYLVRPMGSDILNWRFFHRHILSYQDMNMCILEQLRRSSTGAIDYRKTAEELFRLETFGAVKRYKLACVYCLVDCFADLWDKFSEIFKEIFLCEFTKGCDICHYWTVILSEEDSNLDRILDSAELSRLCECAFKKSTYQGNKAATEYFFRKVPAEKRNSCLLATVKKYLRNGRRGKLHFYDDFPTEKVPEVVRYLFSLMSPEDQMKVLKNQPCDVLRCFLNWPWQDTFLEIADIVWPFLPESNYDQLLSLLIANVRHSDYYAPHFIQDFFIRSPSNFKKHFVFHRDSLFHNFFCAEDTETIRVVFRNLDPEDRVRLVSEFNFFRLLNIRIVAHKWELVELCLREATLSKEEMNRLEEGYMGFLTKMYTDLRMFMKDKWNTLFRFLDKN